MPTFNIRCHYCIIRSECLYTNTPAQVESLQYNLVKAAGTIGLHVNADKMEYICFDQNQKGDIFTLKSGSLRLVDKFTYLGSSISSMEKDINMRLVKVWTVIDRLSVIWRSDLSDKTKRNFFQAAVRSILPYGCTTWMLTQSIEKKLDGNCTRMLLPVLNKSWKQYPTK